MQAQARGMREGGEEEIAEEGVWVVRGMLRSTCARVSSMSLLYWTPEGQAVMQAMQPRQLSMWGGSLVEGASPCGGFGHHVDAAAGGVHLFAPEDVGGAGGEAEAAVDAVGEELFFGRVVRVEGAGFRRVGSR